ncbi:MAG: DNA recombination protein RmuC [Elusimicrobiaceae bacterium]|nr:DNA recombination protein RmuC [Elusimicrobiaceae bacterium]
MIFLAFVIGIFLGGGLVYLWQTAHLKGVLAAHTTQLAVNKARLEEENHSLQREKELIEKNFRDLSATYKAQFGELAAKILEDKTKGLELKNAEALAPLRQDLENFVKKVSDMERQHTAAQARLERGLGDVIKSTEKIDQSALHLTNAIKGESIVRGSWGEETLERILDAAGMKEGLDYFQQVSEEGKRVDVQIALPGDRWIVVDAKTLFNHYIHYFNAQDPKEKQAALVEHVKDVKKTMKDLSAKKYYKKFQAQCDKVQPDYTLMFVYPESALLAAVEADPDILSEAWKNNIALVSATSLMSTLKMVAKLWDIDKQHEYMEDLKEDILKLLEKFNDFLVNFAKAEQAINNAAEAVKIARGHIDGNKGALVPVAQRIVNMYEAPLSKENTRLLKRGGYDYTGLKSKTPSTPPAQLPQEKTAGLFGGDLAE